MNTKVQTDAKSAQATAKIAARICEVTYETLDKDVVATVGGEGDPLLLGGSALRQFKSNTIDNQRNKLILRY